MLPPIQQNTLHRHASLALLFMLTWVGLISGTVPPVKLMPPARVNARAMSRAQAARNLSQLPLAFEQNLGQTDARVKFIARGPGYTLFLSPSATVLALAAPKSSDHSPNIDQGPTAMTVLRMALVESNRAPRLEGLEKRSGTSSYLKGNDRNKWTMDVPRFAKVRYENVYPGIDVVYYGRQQQLEYDLVVSPGADPSAIALSIEGADRIDLDAEGNVVLHTKAGDIRQWKPNVYQTTNGGQQRIAAEYKLTPARDGEQVLSFALGGYDRTQPLVIDPVLGYSTFLGGSGDDQPNTIAVDRSGNIYIAGSTLSTDFPTSPGAYATSCGTDANCNTDKQDIFVAKLAPTAPAEDSLLYATYLGGSNIDAAEALAVDDAGNIYLTGLTYSTDLPTSADAYNTNCPTTTGCGNGRADVFVAELNPAASGSAQLVYSTYLGGSGYDVGTAITVKSSGVYITGYTNSTTFPMSGNAYDRVCGGGNTTGCNKGAYDAFVTRLDPTASAPLQLVYSTFLGGSYMDLAFGLTVDGAGNIYLTGTTKSEDFPTTEGAYDRTCGNGSCYTAWEDIFVTKLNPAATRRSAQLVYSTYLGGRYEEYVYGIAVDRSGNIYIAGTTGSSDFPTTSGAYDTTCGSDGTCNEQPLSHEHLPDAFVAKLNPGAVGSAQLAYSTFLGGASYDLAHGMAVDRRGNIYVTGKTASAKFPTTTNAFDSSCGTDGTCNRRRGAYYFDVFVSKLNPAAVGASQLAYSTFLGGSQHDDAYSLALDSTGNAYVTGTTKSTDWPTSPNAYDASCGTDTPSSCNGGKTDAFVTLLCISRPLRPQLVSPAEGEEESQERVTLKWTRANCADTYRVTVLDITDPNKPVVVDKQRGLRETQYTTVPLSAGHRYKWFVKSCNPQKCSTSAPRTFTRSGM